MKRLALAGVVLAALVVSGLAVAHGNDARTITKVAATFTATSVAGKSSTFTCTTTNGKTLAMTRAIYAGAATGPADLTGAVQIAAASTINTTDNVGVVNGRLQITPSTGGRTELHFTGVYDAGTVVGLATGSSATHAVQILANLSATFSPSAGFSSGKIGGSSGGSAVEVSPASCAPTKQPPPKQPPKQTSTAEGAVSAISSVSITVAGLTCTVPANLAAEVATVKLGDEARIQCSLTSGINTLIRINSRK